MMERSLYKQERDLGLYVRAPRHDSISMLLVMQSVTDGVVTGSTTQWQRPTAHIRFALRCYIS